MPVTERKEAINPKHLQEYPYQVWCDQEGCIFRIVEKTEEAGLRALSFHKCPYKGGETRISPYVSMNAVIESWDKLDAAVIELLEGNWPDQADGSPHPERIRLKGVCRGMAELLALYMKPHFETADQISAEAAKRYKARKAGEEYTTPGLTPQTFGQPRTREWKEGINKSSTPAKSAPTKIAVTDRFKPTELAAIKAAHEMGMMNVTELAKMYKVTEDVIQEVIASGS